jgi:tyrosyl-tRNA synthetase
VEGVTVAERLAEVGAEIPEAEITPDMFTDTDRIWIVKLMTEVEFARTNGEARRLIDGGGVKYNGEPVKDSGLEVVPKTGDVLQVGKRRFARLKVYR